MATLGAGTVSEGGVVRGVIRALAGIGPRRGVCAAGCLRLSAVALLPAAAPAGGGRRGTRRVTGARLAFRVGLVRGATRGMPDIAPRPGCQTLLVAGLPVIGGGAGAGGTGIGVAFGAGLVREANSGVPAIAPRRGGCIWGRLVLLVAGLPAAAGAGAGGGGRGVAITGVGNALEAGVVRGATRGSTATRRPGVGAGAGARVGMIGVGNALEAEVTAGGGGTGLTPP